jgi:hypothetical protein
VIVTAVAAFRGVDAIRNETVALTVFVAAFSEHVVIFFFMTAVAFRAPVMIKATCFSTVGSSPAFLTLGNEFPRSRIFDSNELTANVIHFVYDIFCVDAVLGIPYI